MMESSRNWGEIKSKRQRFQKEDLEDRFSTLPDALLCYIVSFLPTICAVRTTILAKRWNTIWTYVDNYDFEYSMHQWNPNQKRQDFVKFGDMVLRTSNVSSIRRFRLSCLWDHRVHDISKLYVWICTAILRNVREFDLSIRTKSVIVLPTDLFVCKTLVSLKFSSTYFIKIPEIIRFSSLKILKICQWKCLVDDPMKNILANSPVLEELHLQGVIFENLHVLSVRCFTLKRLTIWSLYPKPFKQNLMHDVIIETPELEYLNIKDYHSNGLQVNELPVLTNASVYFFLFDHGVFEFLSRVSNVRHLLLFPKAGMSILRVPDVIPVLVNLTHLEIQIIDNWEFISCLLECSPNLQVLTCEKVSRCSVNRGRGHPGLICEWRPPINTPKCLSCLTRVEIRINGCDSEMQLVRYLLKSATVLETMVIGHAPNFVKKWESRVLKELLRFQRGSVDCEVEFRS